MKVFAGDRLWKKGEEGRGLRDIFYPPRDIFFGFCWTLCRPDLRGSFCCVFARCWLLLLPTLGFLSSLVSWLWVSRVGLTHGWRSFGV